MAVVFKWMLFLYGCRCYCPTPLVALYLVPVAHWKSFSQLLDNVDRVLYYGMLFMFVYVCIYIHFHMYVKSKVMKDENFVSKLSRH